MTTNKRSNYTILLPAKGLNTTSKMPKGKKNKEESTKSGVQLKKEFVGLFKKNDKKFNVHRQNVKFLRENHGLSQKQMAGIIDSTVSAYSNFETGLRNVRLTINQALNVSLYFEVSIWWLYTGREKREFNKKTREFVLNEGETYIDNSTFSVLKKENELLKSKISDLEEMKDLYKSQVEMLKKKA